MLASTKRIVNGTASTSSSTVPASGTRYRFDHVPRGNDDDRRGELGREADRDGERAPVVEHPGGEYQRAAGQQREKHPRVGSRGEKNSEPEKKGEDDGDPAETRFDDVVRAPLARDVDETVFHPDPEQEEGADVRGQKRE